jgi:hypothetical protein
VEYWKLHFLGLRTFFWCCTFWCLGLFFLLFGGRTITLVHLLVLWLCDCPSGGATKTKNRERKGLWVDKK